MIHFIFTSVDSILFLENGFKMMSFDASDKMLKYALKTRWERRKEQAFDKWGRNLSCGFQYCYLVMLTLDKRGFWFTKVDCYNQMQTVLCTGVTCIENGLVCASSVISNIVISLFALLVIEEANWLDLAENHGSAKFPEGGFDAVICLGNSFAHLPDLSGDQENHRIAIRNFHEVLKPGGFLFIDHRNYDAILDSGKAPHRNVYYNVSSYFHPVVTFKTVHIWGLTN
jgi:SAM-dependent methyltransferase